MKSPDTKPVIGISCDIRRRDDGAEFAVLDLAYCDCIVEAGGRPVLLPPRLSDAESMLGDVDGVLLVGGDQEIVPIIADRRLPVLGIGTGMQLLNASTRGTMDEKPTRLKHFDAHDLHMRHKVKIELRTKLGPLYDNQRSDVTTSLAEVVSRHTAIVRTVGCGFRPAAIALDETIEAVESIATDWWALGVQWRPESPAAKRVDRMVFELLVESAGKRDNWQRTAQRDSTGLDSGENDSPLLLSPSEAAARLGMSNRAFRHWRERYMAWDGRTVTLQMSVLDNCYYRYHADNLAVCYDAWTRK